MSAPPAVRPRRREEANLQRAVMQLAKTVGYLVAHIGDSRKEVTRPDGRRFLVGDPEAAGLPDLLLIRERDRRVVWVELKTERGKLRPAQERWIAALTAAGEEVHIWRPSHWDSGEIQRVLAGRTAA